MIKLLSILSAVGMSATSASSIVACGTQQDMNEPAASNVDDQGILTSEFKMKLKKDSISFGPLDGITRPDDSYVTINGLVLINSDIDSQIKNNSQISNELPATFKVKYKDIKENLNNTRDKLTKDTRVKVYLTSDVQTLQSFEKAKIIIVNVANNYDNKINGRTVPIVVELPRLTVMPQPEPIVPIPVVPEPVTPVPIIPMPQPVPNKPDHYIPDPSPCITNNDNIGLLSAEMNDSGTIITTQLTNPANVRINKEQIVVTDNEGNRINVYNVLSEAGDSEVDIILDTPVSKDTKLNVCILGIGNQDGLVNAISVDMSKCKYVPAGWVQWESIWSLTKKTCYYGAAFSWYAFKLSVRAAFLICPCSWPCEIATTCMDVMWVPKYLLDIGMYV